MHCQLTLLKLSCMGESRIATVPSLLYSLLTSEQYFPFIFTDNGHKLKRDTFDIVLDTCLGCLAGDRSPKEIHGRLKCREILHLWMYSHGMQ